MIDFKVSVIIPVYNAEKFVKRSAESAVKLDEVCEVLLIEDGSTDNSLQVCKDLTGKYNKIKFLQHKDKRNHGAGPSRNLGLKRVSFPYVAFLDADDYYTPNRFETTKEIFSGKNNIDGVYECLGIEFDSPEAESKWIKLRGSIRNTTITTIIEPEKLYFSLLFN
jgi:glycosyltransferase involved in cell wall biosynthesis